MQKHIADNLFSVHLMKTFVPKYARLKQLMRTFLQINVIFSNCTVDGYWPHVEHSSVCGCVHSCSECS